MGASLAPPALPLSLQLPGGPPQGLRGPPPPPSRCWAGGRRAVAGVVLDPGRAGLGWAGRLPRRCTPLACVARWKEAAQGLGFADRAFQAITKKTKDRAIGFWQIGVCSRVCMILATHVSAHGCVSCKDNSIRELFAAALLLNPSTEGARQQSRCEWFSAGFGNYSGTSLDVLPWMSLKSSLRSVSSREVPGHLCLLSKAPSLSPKCLLFHQEKPGTVVHLCI